jgi:hypothetical protein
MADPYKNNVGLYLPMEGSRHGDTAILDRTGKTVTRNGDVILSTTVAPPFGTTSAYFDGTGDYLTVTSTAYTYPLTFGTRDFTIELWFYCTDVAAGRTFYDTRHNGQSNWPYGLTFGIYNSYYWVFYNAGNRLISTIPATNNVWIHCALFRVGPTLYLSENGIIKWTYNIGTDPVYCGDNRPIIGSVGDSPGTYPFVGYMKDLVVTVGSSRYTGNFSPSKITTVADDYWANVVLAVHGEGTGTTFTDVSNGAKTITTSGNTTHSTAIAPPFGTSSIYFDGNGDYLSITTADEFNFATGDFTIEGWANVTNYSAVRAILSKYTTWATNLDFYLFINNTTGILYFRAGDTSPLTLTSDSAVPTAAWFHFAVCRFGGVSKMYINGTVQSTTHSGSVSIPNDCTTLRIGCNSDTTPSEYFLGYIKDLRVTKNVARYTQNFNPWRVGDPYYKNTVLLVSGEGSGTTFTDNSLISKTITTNGNTVHSAVVMPPFGSTSIYFDGSGDYLTVPSNEDWTFGTNDFTIEFWCYPTADGRRVLGRRYYVSGINGGWTVYITSNSGSGVWGFVASDGTSITCNINSGPVVQLNSWSHIAVVNRSGYINLAVNGTFCTPAQYTGSGFVNTGTALNIGFDDSTGGGSSGIPFIGYLKDLRIIKGVAKYTANFTPAKVPAQTKSNGAPIAFADKTAIKTIANSYDWDSPEPVRIML